MIVRKNSLILLKDGKELDYSALLLISRSAGVYAEVKLSVKTDITEGEEISVYYKDDEDVKTLIATVVVYAIPYNDSSKTVFCCDTYREKLKTMVENAGWRNVTPAEVLEKVFSECDVDKYDISALPVLTLPHFSYSNRNGWSTLEHMLSAIEKANGNTYCVMPSPDGTLKAGKLMDIAPTDKVTLTSDNLISRGDKHFKACLVPLTYAQKFSLDGKDYQVDTVCYRVTPKSRECEIWTL